MTTINTQEKLVVDQIYDDQLFKQKSEEKLKLKKVQVQQLQEEEKKELTNEKQPKSKKQILKPIEEIKIEDSSSNSDFKADSSPLKSEPVPSSEESKKDIKVIEEVHLPIIKGTLDQKYTEEVKKNVMSFDGDEDLNNQISSYERVESQQQSIENKKQAEENKKR